jgi:hypothetical protein
MLRTTIASLLGLLGLAALATGALAAKNDGVSDDGQVTSLEGLTQYAQASQSNSSNSSNSKKKPSNPPVVKPPKERPDTKPPIIKPPKGYWCKDKKKYFKKSEYERKCKPKKPVTDD